MNEIKAALQAILDGYYARIERHHDVGTDQWLAFICVVNPDYEPDNGAAPYLVIDVGALLEAIE